MFFELNAEGARLVLAELTISGGGAQEGARQGALRTKYVEALLVAGIVTDPPPRVQMGGFGAAWEESQIKNLAGCPNEIELIRTGVPAATGTWYQWRVTTSEGWMSDEFQTLPGAAVQEARRLAQFKGHYGPATLEAVRQSF